MALRIVRRDGGRFAPVLFCDHCGEIIESATQGNVLWDAGQADDGAGAEAFFAHKRCSDAMDVQAGRWLSWFGLTALPVYLEGNLGIKHREAVEYTLQMAGVE